MSFAAFSEQQPTAVLLQRSLERGRLAHAYLFAGPHLAELEDMARTLAQTLNCQNPPRRSLSGVALDCCDTCLNCRRIAAATHADVQWVRPESKLRVITIDQIRELMQTLHLKPLEGGYKVVLIVGADRLNVQAANAFLKTLEEPPAKSIMVLLSTDPEKIMETIQSRCLRLNLGGGNTPRFSPQNLAWLSAFVNQAAAGAGGLLDRYRLLGMLLSRLTALRAEVEKELSARSPLEHYEDVDPHLREKWEEELSAAVEAEYRGRRMDLLGGVHGWLRDVWVATLKLEPVAWNYPDLAAAAKTVARKITTAQASDNIKQMEKTRRLLESNVQEALAMEVSLLKLEL
jgi:DNA polymerase-3 subunit delta'